MKLKYIIPSFIALIAMFVSCSEDNDPTYLDEVKVSQSIVALPTEGGSATITVNASSAWQFAKVIEEKNTDETTYTEVPSWLTVNKLSGDAGLLLKQRLRTTTSRWRLNVPANGSSFRSSSLPKRQSPSSILLPKPST